jgi:hypothetical protein
MAGESKALMLGIDRWIVDSGIGSLIESAAYRVSFLRLSCLYHDFCIPQLDAMHFQSIQSSMLLTTLLELLQDERNFSSFPTGSKATV